MLIRHGFAYAWARGLPSLVSLAALAIFTRLVDVAAYGEYAAATAVVVITNAVLFQWLRTSALRFIGEGESSDQVLTATIRAFTWLTVAVIAVGAAIWVAQPSDKMRAISAFTTGLIVLQAWFELNLDVLRARLQPTLFGIASLFKALVALGLGTAFAMLGWGAQGLLLGLAVGTLAPSALFSRWIWSAMDRDVPTAGVLKKMLSYGLPLSGSFAASAVIRSSDRLMIGWLMDPSALGIYAAAVDLTTRSLETILTVINAAAFPLAVRALRDQGVEGARSQLRQNLLALVGVALPASAGLALVSGGMSTLMLGPNFAGQAAVLMPWVAAAVFLSGMRAYYVDHAFQLGKTTHLQLLILAIAAATNILLNLILIPRTGLFGALTATLVAYAVALVVGVVIARRAFPLPLPLLGLARVVGATMIMCAVLVLVPAGNGVAALTAKIGLGAASYALALWILAAPHQRKQVVRMLKMRFKT